MEIREGVKQPKSPIKLPDLNKKLKGIQVELQSRNAKNDFSTV